MAKRFAITPLLAPSGPDGWRSCIADVRPVPNIREVIPIDPATGKPKYNFALVIFASTDVPTIAALPGVTLLPDTTLDTAMGSVASKPVSDMQAAIPGYDLTGAGKNLAVPAYQPTDAYSKVVAGLLAQFDPALPLTALDVPDVVR